MPLFFMQLFILQVLPLRQSALRDNITSQGKNLITCSLIYTIRMIRLHFNICIKIKNSNTQHNITFFFFYFRQNLLKNIIPNSGQSNTQPILSHPCVFRGRSHCHSPVNLCFKKIQRPYNFIFN